MTKYGVGVGEEFPVDENKPEASENEEDSRCCGRGAHAARRDAWRRFRHQMKAEWIARHRGFHHRMRGGDRAETMDDFRAHHMKMLVVGGLAVVGLAALLGALGNRR